MVFIPQITYRIMAYKLVFFIIISLLISLEGKINSTMIQQKHPVVNTYYDDTDSIVVEASTKKTKIVNIITNDDLHNNDVVVNNDGSVVSNLLEEETQCICVPYYLCRNNTIVTDGSNIIDIRLKPPSCESYLDVCCEKPSNINYITTERPDRFPDRIDDNSNSGCGKRNSEGIDVRIRGDTNNEAQYGEFPWMIAVLKIEKIDDNISINMYVCGGSLIHPNVVLTAAHCIVNENISNLFVRAGEWDTQTKHERYPFVEQRIKQKIVHENFYSGGLFNDIALLITEQPIPLANQINTVCLPQQNSIPTDVVCTASGWGKDKFGKIGNYQVILKKVDLPIVQRDNCERQLRTTRLSRFFKLHDSFVCAGGEAGRDTCKGDGGGPLVCPVTLTKKPGDYQIRYEQTGIVSWGVNCGENNIPGVYVKVALFRKWIDNWMINLNFDTKYYTMT